MSSSPALPTKDTGTQCHDESEPQNDNAIHQLTLPDKEETPTPVRDPNNNDNNDNPETGSAASSDNHVPPSSPPTLTNVQIDECSSDECILIPKHAVVDDVSMKFILHPSLVSGLPSGSNLELCADGVKTPEFKESIGKTGIQRAKTFVKGTRLSPSTKTPPISSRTASGEQYVIKTAKEILYDIAKGKWNRQGMIPDEDVEGIKTLGSKPCSNANCVRAAEIERKRREQLMFKSSENNGNYTVFEDGDLPSYHSLLNLWKSQKDEKQRHTWLLKAFKKGYPENENEFLKVWRECRKYPEAYGINVSKPKELPDLVHERQQRSRARKVLKPYIKRFLVAEAVTKNPPVRLASKEYYDPDWKPVKSLTDRQKQKNRYDHLRSLYPHLPVLKNVDYKMNPATVKYRMKQAEDWHKMVGITNKPTPVLQLSHYTADTRNNSEKTKRNGEYTSDSTDSSELDFQISRETPRYASNTKSSINRIRNTQKYI